MDPEIASNGMGIAHLLSQNSGVGLILHPAGIDVPGTCYYALLKGYLAQRDNASTPALSPISGSTTACRRWSASWPTCRRRRPMAG